MRLLAILATALVLLAGCGEPEETTSTEVSLPQDRLELPEYDFAAYRALIEKLQGKPLVANFWGSWCPPCEDEAPHLAEVSREYEGRVQFLGINMVDARAPAREFIERHDLPYPNIFDPRDTIRTGLGYLGQPITLVYSASGDLEWEHVGAIDADILREQIDAVL